MGRLLLYLAPLVLTIYCLVSAITAKDDEVRHLQRVWWIVMILLFPLVGSVAWLIAGRPVTPRPRAHERRAPQFPEYDRPGRAAAADAAADEAFLRQVRERAEQQRRAHLENKRREQRRAQPGQQGPTEPPGTTPA